MRSIPVILLRDVSQYVTMDIQSNPVNTNDLQRQYMKLLVSEVIEQDLTERQKQLIMMYYVRGMKQEEIAEELGITKGTVSLTIKRGVNRIKKSKKIKKFLKIA